MSFCFHERWDDFGEKNALLRGEFFFFYYHRKNANNLKNNIKIKIELHYIREVDWAIDLVDRVFANGPGVQS